VKVLVTDRFSTEALAKLKSRSQLQVTQSASFLPSADELKDVSALIIRSRTKINEEVLAQAPILKLIVTSTSGFDHIDFAATRKYSVTVMHTPEANAQSAAELTWLLVLACARKFTQAQTQIKKGEWKRDALVGSTLSGKTYGVIGLGRIGSRVARFAKAFGMNVVAFDPYIEPEDFVNAGADRTSFEELLRLADIVSLHVPATPETKKMINFRALEGASPDLILVNTSRGDVVNEPELIKALEQKLIKAVGLDVFASEPLAQSSPLLKMPQVVLSPHIGATTEEAFGASSVEAATKIIDFLENGRSSDVLPPKTSWFSHNGSLS
jgi:D-3-phosphoglycerate dehydrogenase / 2-oxoglutarate reductase